MSRRPFRKCPRRLLTLVLAFLSLAALATALVSRGSDVQPLRVARGVSDGSFHPIAGAFAPDATKLKDCAERDVRCLEQGFGNLAYSAEPKAAMALFDRRRAADKTIAKDCHRIAHMIGSAALALRSVGSAHVRSG